MSFPGGSAGKEYACNVGDLGSIPSLGRSPGEGNSYPLQYSGLENTNNRIPLSNFHFFIYFFFFLVSRISHSKFSSGNTTFSFLVVFIILSSFLNLLILSCCKIQSLVFFFYLPSFCDLYQVLWFYQSTVCQ